MECLDKLHAFFRRQAKEARKKPSAPAGACSKKLTRNTAAHVITGKKISTRSGAKAELAKLLDLPSSTVRQWFHGSQRSGVTNKLLIILTVLQQDGLLESTIARAQEYEIITEEDLI
jgi:DNA-binding transcriptional regulator YiaG